MKALMIILILVLSQGCTKYVIEKATPDGGTTIVRVSSTRDLEQPELHYNRSSDKGHASFDFKAAGVDNNSDMFMGTMMQMMQMFQQMMLTMPADQ